MKCKSFRSKQSRERFLLGRAVALPALCHRQRLATVSIAVFLGRKAGGASHPAQPWADKTPSGNALHPSGGAGAPGGKAGARRKGMSEGAERSTPCPQLGADPRHLWMLPAPLSPAGKGPMSPEGSCFSQAGATFVLSISPRLVQHNLNTNPPTGTTTDNN